VEQAFPRAGRTPDQQDAYATAEWLPRADGDGSLEKFLCPELEPHERKAAKIEGWVRWRERSFAPSPVGLLERTAIKSYKGDTT